MWTLQLGYLTSRGKDRDLPEPSYGPSLRLATVINYPIWKAYKFRFTFGRSFAIIAKKPENKKRSKEHQPQNSLSGQQGSQGNEDGERGHSGRLGMIEEHKNI